MNTRFDELDERHAVAQSQPALKLLAEAIDREFQRREPTHPTPYEYAAAQLGVHANQLVILDEDVQPAVAHSVGRWLFDAQARYGAEHAGAYPARPPASERVPGATGDVRAFNSAMVVLPAGALCAAQVVLRIVTEHYGVGVEVIGRAQDADLLGEAFAAFLHVRRTADSPYRLGAYRLTNNARGLALTRWTPPAASRELLKLDDAVWQTVDRGVHRVLDLADDLKARGLGTSTGVLLVGPPGTGKTQLGTVVANELLGRTTVLVPGTYVTEHFLTELFDLAADLSPCLVLMDDLDLIAGERGQTNPHRLREFLNVMDGGLADRSGVVVIASTNDHRKIDKARAAVVPVRHRDPDGGAGRRGTAGDPGALPRVVRHGPGPAGGGSGDRWCDRCGPEGAGSGDRARDQRRRHHCGPHRGGEGRAVARRAPVRGSVPLRAGPPVARALNLPRKTFSCGGVCHGTMTMWFNHRFRGAALTVEYNAHPSRRRMTVTAPRQVLTIWGA
jgi:hypothetical protein